MLNKHLASKKRLTVFDKIVIAAAFMYPLTGLAQVYNVFQGHIDGVSLLSWFGFISFATLFLIYGSIHDIKPMIISNTIWLVVDGLVIVGLLVNNKII